ncbi:hypothetical protein D3C87_278370 [compost metagenome]
MFEKDKFNPNKVRLIFLDVDGVLISNRTMLQSGYWATSCKDYEIPDAMYRSGKGRVILKEPYVNHAESVDPIAVTLLNKLMETTDAYIVLSSTWREGLDMEGVKQVLGAMGINTHRVIGRTSQNEGSRGDQIWNFIQGMKERRIGEFGDFFVNSGFLIDELEGVVMTLDSYVIIDDINAFRPEQQDKFVQTSEDDGLLLSDILIAGSILIRRDFTVRMLQDQEVTDARLIRIKT